MPSDAERPSEDRGDPEERLLVEAAQKDPGRFTELYERHVGLVYAYVARRVGDRSQAEDVTSEVFHRALAALPRFEWRGTPFAAWLYRIAANEISTLRSKSLREVASPDADAGVDPGAGPDLSEAERRAALARALDDLPADQRRVVLLRFFEEKSIREVAGELGRSPGAIKQLQYRALESLRAQMDRGDV